MSEKTANLTTTLSSNETTTAIANLNGCETSATITIGNRLLPNIQLTKNKINTLINSLAQGEGLIAWLGILFLAGFTPLPYKVFTIASGLIGFNLLIFIIVSLISRSLRFFIIAYLSYKFGDLFTEFMNKHGSKWFTALGVLLVLVFIIILLVIKFNA